MSDDMIQQDFETVYEVFHKAEYGFHGNTSIYVAVKRETEDKIEGYEFSPMHDSPGERVVINKDNVAGWKEQSHMYQQLPEGTRF